MRFASKFTNNSDSSLKFACKIRTIFWGFNILNNIWRQSKVNSKCVTRSHQIKYLLRLVHSSNSQANKQEKVHALLLGTESNFLQRDNYYHPVLCLNVSTIMSVDASVRQCIYTFGCTCRRACTRNAKVKFLFTMTSCNGNIFRVTGNLCGEFTGHRWIPRTMASDAELWCFLWSRPD